MDELIEFVRSASPFIWEAMYRQVYVNAFAKVGMAIVLVIALIPTIRGANKLWTSDKEGWNDDRQTIGVFIYSVVAGMLTIIFILLVAAAARLANPNYYAIQMILENLK